MNLRLRCTSLTVEPSDTSGFWVEIEVAESLAVLAQALTREQILQLDEKTMRVLLGDVEFEKLAEESFYAAARALKTTAPTPEADDTGD